jgi:hypothetical protein
MAFNIAGHFQTTQATQFHFDILAQPSNQLNFNYFGFVCGVSPPCPLDSQSNTVLFFRRLGRIRQNTRSFALTADVLPYPAQPSRMGAGRGENLVPVIVAIIISQNAEDKDKNQSKIGKNKSDWNCI